MLGDAMFYGSGAGSLPTASAVAADVVECAKNPHKNVAVPGTGEKLNILSYDEEENTFFVRVTGDPAERLAGITALFGEVETVSAEGVEGEFGFITGRMKEKVFAEKLSGLEGVKNRIRVM